MIHDPGLPDLKVASIIASIAIRIMSDTRDEEKDRNKDQQIKGALQDIQDPRTNCKMYVCMLLVIVS